MVRRDNHDIIIIIRFGALKWRWWRRWRWRKEWEKEFYWEIPAASLMVPRSEKWEYLSRSEKRRIFWADLKTHVFVVDDRISQCGKLTFSILLVSLRRNLIWSPAGNSRREKGETWKKSRNCAHFGNSSWFQTLPAIFWAENREIISFTLENPNIASFSAN